MPDTHEQSEMDNNVAAGAGTAGQPNGTPAADDTQAQLAEMREQLSRVNAESAKRRKQLEAYEAEAARRQEAEMSETEKANKKLAEMAQANAELQQRYESTLIRAAVTNTAHGLGFRDAEVALKLLPDGAVTLDADGNVIGAEAALKALAKEHEYLLKPVETSDPDAGKRSKGDKAATNLEEIARKYGITN